MSSGLRNSVCGTQKAASLRSRLLRWREKTHEEIYVISVMAVSVKRSCYIGMTEASHPVISPAPPFASVVIVLSEMETVPPVVSTAAPTP